MVRVILNEPSLYVGRFLSSALKSLENVEAVDEDFNGGIPSVEAVDESIVYWGDYDSLAETDWDAIFQNRGVYASVYCIRKGLIRKGQLAATLDEYFYKKGSAVKRFHPETVSVDVRPQIFSFGGASVDAAQVDVESRCLDAIDLMEERDGKLWIVKPSLADRAEAISVVTSPEQLVECIERHPDLMQWVVQEYVEKPLLIDDRKFHLRVYVFCVGDLSVYVYNDMLALIAPSTYTCDRSDMALEDATVHITNTCKHASSDGFSESKFIRVFSSDTCHLSPKVVSTIKSRINDAVGHLFAAMESNTQGFMPASNCCEVFGVDFLVEEESLQPILLEVNAIPDLKNTGSELEALIQGLVEGMVGIAFSSWFGKEENDGKYRETFTLAHASSKKRAWGTAKLK